MIRFVLRWAINAVALYAAIAVANNLIPHGIALDSTNWQSYIWMALIFGLINALLRPLLTLLTCPLIILTLGLFTLIINVLLFYLVGWIGSFFSVGFTVNSFLAALVASIVISVVSIVLSMFIHEGKKNR